jgi:hypothetical protein
VDLVNQYGLEQGQYIAVLLLHTAQSLTRITYASGPTRRCASRRTLPPPQPLFEHDGRCSPSAPSECWRRSVHRRAYRSGSELQHPIKEPVASWPRRIPPTRTSSLRRSIEPMTHRVPLVYVSFAPPFGAHRNPPAQGEF